MTKTTSSSKQNGRVAMYVPDPEVVAQAKRRQFTAVYKRQIVAQADACTAHSDAAWVAYLLPESNGYPFRPAQ